MEKRRKERRKKEKNRIEKEKERVSYSEDWIPSICIRSSDLTRLEASCSDSEPLREQSESISSMKMVLGA